MNLTESNIKHDVFWLKATDHLPTATLRYLGFCSLTLGEENKHIVLVINIHLMHRHPNALKVVKNSTPAAPLFLLRFCCYFKFCRQTKESSCVIKAMKSGHVYWYCFKAPDVIWHLLSDQFCAVIYMMVCDLTYPLPQEKRFPVLRLYVNVAATRQKRDVRLSLGNCCISKKS